MPVAPWIGRGAAFAAGVPADPSGIRLRRPASQPANGGAPRCGRRMSGSLGAPRWPGGPPEVAVNIRAPDIRRWLPGNCGVPGAWSFAAGPPGPHVALTALMHGNEIAGAVVLDRLLREGLRPARGRLSLVFCNIEAFARFDPADPTATRFLDEDMNRLWSRDVLGSARRSVELRRARELRPLIDTVDVLIDLHSMLWPSEPLILAGEPARGMALGVAVGVPRTVVADFGHAGGRRLIDYGRFCEPHSRAAAILVEAGAHWEASTVACVEQACARALIHAGLAAAGGPLAQVEPAPPPRRARVTQTITAATHGFAFQREFRGGEVIPRRDTLIARDGEHEIRTPHDDCLLVMPTPLAPRGHTAVRLARFLD